MSAITKPFIKFTTADSGYDTIIVNVEQVQSAEKVKVYPTATAIQQGIGSATKYGILFTMVPVESETKNITIVFSDETDRNDALTEFYAVTTTDVTP